MARDLSIAISIQDKFSPSLNTISRSMKAFDKDAEETDRQLESLEKKQDSLRNSQARLQTTMDGLSKAMRDAKKDYSGLADVSGTQKLEGLHKQYNQAAQDMKGFGKEIQTTQTQMKNLIDTQIKGENRAGSMFGGGFTGKDSALNKIASAGLGKMVGDSVTGAVNAGISSAFGSRTGDAISTTLSGTVTGAAIGSLIPGLGVVGTAVGGALGTVAGGINAATQSFKKDDDAYRSLVQQQYTQLTEKEASDVASGSALAAQRQVDKIAFSRMLGGSNQADEYLSWARKTASDTPFLYDDVAQMSKTLGSYGYEPERMKEMIVAIGDTGAALGAETYDMQMMIKGLGRIKQSGKTNLEYLNPMIERGVPVWDYLREGLSEDAGRELTVKEVQEMSSLNQIDGTRAVEILIEKMQQNYGGMMEEQSKTYSGLQSTLKGWEQENQAAFGEGYNSVKEIGLADQIKYFEGDGGESIREANRYKGQWLAELENSKAEFQRNAQTSIMTGDIDEGFKDEAVIKRLQTLAEAYDTARKKRDFYEQRITNGRMTEEERAEAEEQVRAAGVEMGAALQEGEMLGQNEYTASDGAKLFMQSQLDLIGGIQADAALNSSYYTTGFKLSEKLSEGIVSGIRGYRPAISAELGYLSNYLTGDSPSITSGTGSTYAANSGGASPTGGVPPGRAFGMTYIPRDDYLARLHEGERVLTAAEARDYKNPSSGVVVTGNNFVIREDADVDRIARALAEQLARAQMIS